MFRDFVKRLGLILIKRDPGTVIDFVGNRKKFMIISAVLIGLSVLALVVNEFIPGRNAALNYGTDFKGGTQIQIEFRKVKGLGAAAVRKSMADLKYKRVTVIKVASGAVESGVANAYLIRMETESSLAPSLVRKLHENLAAELKNPKTGNTLLFRFRVSPAGDSAMLQFHGPVTDEQIRQVFAKVQGIKIADADDAITRPGRPELYKVRVSLQGVGERLRQGLNRELKAFVPKTGKDEYLVFSDSKPFSGQALADAIKGAGYGPNEVLTAHVTVQVDRIMTEAQFKELLKGAGVHLLGGPGGLAPLGDEGDKRWRLALVGKASSLESGLQGKLTQAHVSLIKSLRVRGYGAVKEIKSVVAISSKVGHRLRNDGIVSVLIALGLLLVYIGLRFDLKYAPGAIIALFHDVIITVGVFAIAWREFNLDIIAALLTIVGYSLNDTIVVFDRIRENVGRLRDRNFEKVVNTSVNETMSRTVLTSFTTFLVVLVILVLARGVIWDFAFALGIGIIVGTYSSIFIASPIAIWLQHRFESKEGRSKARSKAASKRAKANT